MGFGTKPRLRCPNCNSYRVEGTKNEHKCKRCGYEHGKLGRQPKLIAPNILETVQKKTTPNIFEGR